MQNYPVLESNPHAIHIPKIGLSADDGITRCGQYVSRIARITRFASLVTCMTCLDRMTDSERSIRREDDGKAS
jgi:hypothetical protein